MGKITNNGDHAEGLFCRLTGAVQIGKARDMHGDAYLDTPDRSVEIKVANSDSINQVRPIQYLTLVIRSEHDNEWYVVPANDVFRLVAASGRRGQHSLNPFENCQLSKKQLTRYKVPPEADLREVVLRAIRRAKRDYTCKRQVKLVREHLTDAAETCRRLALVAS